MCQCNNRIEVVVPESIAVTVTGTGATAIATITLPSTFIPVEGGIYDISLAAAIPDGTSGAIVNITNGTATGDLLNRLGSNVRMGALNPQWILRVMYLSDPEHFNLISRRWRRV